MDGQSHLTDRRLIGVEMMYRPRPPIGNAQMIFDNALRSRLGALNPAQDAVLIVADGETTLESLRLILNDYPRLMVATCIANPPPYGVQTSDTPTIAGWPTPDRWRRYARSDRWARLEAAFTIADRLDPHSALMFAAHDAIWGQSLPDRLLALSRRFAQGGQPAAISPLSFYRHSALPGVALPQPLIDLTNVAFNRDPLLACRLHAGHLQGFWGKTGLIPAGVCRAIRSTIDHTFLEDDSEIDRAIRATGAISRAVWIRNPNLYRQTLTIFSEADLRHVIERTLHYSLPAGHSGLLAAPDRSLKLVRAFNPRYRRYWQAAQRIIAEAQAAIQARVDRYGLSWFDWGAYRYGVRPGDPEAEVWRLA